MNKFILLLLVFSPLFMKGQSSQEKSLLQEDALSNNINKNYLESNTKKWSGYNFGSVDLSGSGGDYYIDSENGNDSNTGTSPDQAWASLTPVNNATFTAGDTILFARGSEFEGTLTVKYSGSSGNPIVFGAYGSGPNPKIYGSKVITGWTPYEGDVWKATVDADDVKQLFLDDDRMQLARYPDKGYFTVTKKTSNTVFISGLLKPDIDYTGATCFVRSNLWTIDAVKVSGSNLQTITLSSSPPYGVREDYGFWLVDKLEFLTKPGEWYYDSKTNTLYFWPPVGDSPDNHIVRASVFSYGVNITSKNYITVQDIELVQAGVTGIYVSVTNDIQIKNCIITDPDKYGIFDLSSRNNSIYDNNLIVGANSGIALMYGEGTTATNNLIRNSGDIKNLNKTTVNQGLSGIFIRGDNHIIHFNRIIDSGYIGINSSGLNVNIKYNYVDGACQELDDGGGIYVMNGSVYDTQGTVIENNIVKNVFGGKEGTPVTSTFSCGIYLDSTPEDVKIQHNTISSVQTGLYIKGGKHIVSYNLIYDFMIGARSRDIKGDVSLEGNIFMQSNRLNTYTWWPTTKQRGRMIREDDNPSFYDFNKYYAHYSGSNLFYIKGYRTFSEWQSAYENDVNGSIHTGSLPTGVTEQIIYNDTKQSKTFYLNNAKNVIDAFSGSSITVKIVLEPFTGKALIGQSVDCILDYEDSEAPVITDFTLVESSSGLTVTPLTLASTGDATAYIFTESVEEPNLYDSGWSLKPSYKFDSEGEKTVYVWARDAAGNISKSFIYTLELTSDGKIGMAKSIKIYPNPANNSINIIGVDTGNRINIYSDSGVLISERIAVSPLEIISLDRVSSGILMIVISNDHEIIGRFKAVKN